MVITLCLTTSLYPEENNQMVFIGVSKTIDFYNTKKYFSLLGYRIVFPETVGNEYRLRSVSLGVSLAKQVHRTMQEPLSKRMSSAIEDNQALKALGPYNPYRRTGAFYIQDSQEKVIVVATMPSEKYNIVENHPENPDVTCTTFQRKHIQYFWKVYDLAAVSPTLSWEQNNITYMIFSLNGKALQKKEAVTIADYIQQCQ
jgi:hypothetical protein